MSRAVPADAFYNALADDYHLVYADWRASVLRQGAVLEQFLRERVDSPCAVLDCTCGIGTQAIGLALHGYAVRGTDVSADSVARAEREAASFGVAVDFAVADVRTLSARVHDDFDVVLSCDNALPHLLTDEDLSRALREMRSRLRPGGLLVVGLRDYDRLAAERPRAMPPVSREGPEGRSITFQLWDWAADGRTYDFELFVLREHGGAWVTRSYASRYRALRRAELEAALRAAGFEDLAWHPPEETGFYQPLATARAPGR
jgi:SAM-dependent methyltransferase